MQTILLIFTQGKWWMDQLRGKLTCAMRQCGHGVDRFEIKCGGAHTSLGWVVPALTKKKFNGCEDIAILIIFFYNYQYHPPPSSSKPSPSVQHLLPGLLNPISGSARSLLYLLSISKLFTESNSLEWLFQDVRRLYHRTWRWLNPC